MFQVDHTRADVIVVDEETREPIGGPWLTLAIDVFSGLVTGFYLTMDAPSRLSVSPCLLHSVFDKSAWLKDRGIDGLWPVRGYRRSCMSIMAPSSAAAPLCEAARTPASRLSGGRDARRTMADISNV
jgi:transposase InsO family protein